MEGWGRRREARERAGEGAGGGRRGFPSSLLALVPGVRWGKLAGEQRARGGGSPLSRLCLCPPQRHGLAVCLALTTMCTSLLLMYGGIGIGGGRSEPRRRQQQQQVAAVPSRPPERGQRHPALPVGAGLLEGYISVLEHKVSRRPRDRRSLPPRGTGTPRCPRLPRGHRRGTRRALPPAPPRCPSACPGCPACPAVGVALSGLRAPSGPARGQELPGSEPGSSPVGHLCSAASLLPCTVEGGEGG